MIEGAQIDTLLSGPLGNWLEEQALVREQAKADTVRRRWNAAIVLVPLAAILIILVPIGPSIKLWITGLSAVAAWAWAEMPKKKAVKAVKVGINDAIAGSLGMTYSHDCDPERPFDLARFCRLVPRHDRASFEDRWSGHFGDIPFSLHEAKLEERQGSGKNRRWVTVFRGVIMSVGYKRRFSGTTVLVRDNRHRKFWGGKRDFVEVDGQRLDYAPMAHPDFEDTFDIYTSDRVEAHYLIDPLYIERLIALEAAYKGSDVGTIFHEGQIVVALKTENLFESGSIEARDDRTRIETTLDQFARLQDLARTLNERGPVPGRQV